MHLLPLVMLAAAFWGQTPACGTPAVKSGELLPPVIGLADPGGCLILVDPTRFQGAGWACMVILHEDGHLIGYYDPIGFRWPDGRIDHSHSPDPESVMYPVISHPVWPCKW